MWYVWSKFKINELDKNVVVANFATTATEGKFIKLNYNLDAIISFGYRVIDPVREDFFHLRYWLFDTFSAFNGVNQ